MTGSQLATSDPKTCLVPIDIERDAPLGVEWLKGKSGRVTLHNMGVPDVYNHESTVELERERLQMVVDDPNELAWMIQVSDVIVGIVEIRLEAFEHLPGPNVSIMIGNTAYSGQGIGTHCVRAAIEYLFARHNPTVYARHLTNNAISEAMLQSLGFKDFDAVYTDDNNLEWQNMELRNG